MFKAYINYKLSGGLWDQPEALDSKPASVVYQLCEHGGGYLDPLLIFSV